MVGWRGVWGGWSNSGEYGDQRSVGGVWGDKGLVNFTADRRSRVEGRGYSGQGNNIGAGGQGQEDTKREGMCLHDGKDG